MILDIGVIDAAAGGALGDENRGWLPADAVDAWRC
jgi:hypothetical protein